MGIRLLNSFLLNTCKSGINKKKLYKLSGKKLAIDILIYIYKFKKEGYLFEKIIQMVNILISSNITPVFIFDGKYREEKKQEQQNRAIEKKMALEKIVVLEDKLETEDLSQNIIDEVKEEILSLKKKAVKVKSSEIATIKNIFKNMGVSYINAPGEADELCCYLEKNKIVNGVMSEDMDMFAYGVHKIYRYFSLLKENVVEYDLHIILKGLKIKFHNFQKLLFYSGTDYNTENKEKHNIYWIYKNRRYILDKVLKKEDEMIQINKLKEIFSLKNSNLEEYASYEIEKNNLNKSGIKDLLQEKSFYFV